MNYTNSVQETSTSTSSAVIDVLGATAGRRTFASKFTTGTTNIPLRVQMGNDWVTGLFTLTDADTLTRTWLEDSSNGGADVTFGAGTKTVSCVPLAELFRLGVTDPDDAGFDIVLLAGQSNMCGRGALDSLVEFADPRVWQFGGASGDGRYRTIFAGNDPLHNQEGVNTGQMSLGTAAGKAYGSTRPSQRKVMLVPCASGGTSLVFAPAPWAAGSPGGTLYENAVSQANLAVTAALLQYPNSRFVGVYWHQGENDAVNNISQSAYATALKAVIAGLRTRITGAANSWFVIGGMVPEAISGSPSSYNPINAAHIQVASEVSHCIFVAGPSGYTPDSLHYNAAGSRIMGARMALSVLGASRFIAVDATAPTLASAVVANATPTKVVLTMSEVMDPANQPPTSAFVVTGHTVSASVVSGSQIELTVTAAFVNGEAARTVAYTQPGGADNARDLAGNLLASFGATAITNNVQPVDSTPPTFASAVVENSTPTKLTITMSEACAASVPTTGAFTATGSTSGSKSFSGIMQPTSSTIELTVTAAFVTGETITYGYTQPGANPRLQDAAGNVTVSASSQPVTNNISAGSYATWNASDKSSAITLSNGNKTATASNANDDTFKNVRATLGKSSGKWYWEITLNSGSPTIMLGITDAAMGLDGSFPGLAANGLGWYSDNGAIYKDGAGDQAAGGTQGYGIGDVLGIAFNADASPKTVTFFKNNVQNTAQSYSTAGTTMYPVAAIRQRTTSPCVATVNFGASAFVYTPPSGFVGLQ